MDQRIRTSRQLECNLAYTKRVLLDCKRSMLKLETSPIEDENLLDHLCSIMSEINSMQNYLRKKAKLWELLNEANGL